MTQPGQAATSHSWQRADRPGCSSVAPHSHVVGIVVLLAITFGDSYR